MTDAPVILIAPASQAQGAEFGDYSLSLSAAYTQSIMAGGGIPWVLPLAPQPKLISESVRRSSGVLLTGGEDVQPSLYRKRLPAPLKAALGPPDAARDLAELVLIEEVFRQRKPLLAICRGQQLLNVAFGGTLLVDIALQKPRAIGHRRNDLKDSLVHDIQIEPNSMLFQIFRRSTMGVNSSHHQAVDKLAAPFRATATSPDGIVEAMELSERERHLLPYLVAVQFHPERLIGPHPHFVNLFRSFVQVCAAESKRNL